MKNRILKEAELRKPKPPASQGWQCSVNGTEDQLRTLWQDTS